jgi:ABC-type nickel/cobalt efflux system permease component RcnA
MVIAYLVSSKATTKHAIFLGLMTTATHTLGIFILGIITLLLSKYILPEQLYPFLSLTSGLGIIIVAGYLFKKRVLDSFKKDTSDHHHHDHEHDHSHHHQDLSITDTDAEIEWSSLITLGISSGLIPCPAALILLLGTITVGNISLGILLVLMFSLGLAITLITIGILSIKAKTFFSKIPTQINLTQKLAMIAPIFIFIVGLIMTYKVLNQLPLII